MIIDGAAYPVLIRRLTRSRSIAVSADAVKGAVRLTMPTYASTGQALRFAQSKADWLAQQFAASPPPVALVDGAEIALAGETVTISWSSAYRRTPEYVGSELRLGGPEHRIGDRVLAWLKTQARAAFAEDLDYYCAQADVDLPTLSVGDARRRWGSCSAGKSGRAVTRRAIRLNWRLIMAPPAVRRSVVAHEVAHLRHMNHSPAFYAELDRIFEGDRKAADRWLKDHGMGLHLIGAKTG